MSLNKGPRLHRSKDNSAFLIIICTDLIRPPNKMEWVYKRGRPKEWYLTKTYAKVVAWPAYEAPAKSDYLNQPDKSSITPLPIKIHTVCEELESSWAAPDQNANGRSNARDGHIDQNRPSNLSAIGPCGAHKGGSNCKCGRT